MVFESIEEVAQDCKVTNRTLVVYNDQVLDLTDFQHPGPKEYITDNVGKDITKLFEDEDHSNYAKKLTQKYVIGELKTVNKKGKLM
jgi:cytochrome b involved in lipid metabolism